VALDGTKVKANAALDANRTASSIEAEIARMLAEAEAVDAREDHQFQDQRGDVLPEGLTKAADRQARLMACKAKLEKRAAEAVARQQAKIDARRVEEQATGKRRRGRKPKAPDPTVDPDAVANVTDPESGIMKTRQGWVQGYNAQIVVTREQIILAADVTTEANDNHQLTGMLNQAQANVEIVLGEDAVLGAAVVRATALRRVLRGVVPRSWPEPDQHGQPVRVRLMDFCGSFDHRAWGRRVLYRLPALHIEVARLEGSDQ